MQSMVVSLYNSRLSLKRNTCRSLSLFTLALCHLSCSINTNICWHGTSERKGNVKGNVFTHTRQIKNLCRSHKPAFPPASSTRDSGIRSFLTCFLRPSFRIDLLLMPERLRGRVTGGRGGCKFLTGFFISQTGSLVYISRGAGTVISRPQG